MLTRLYIEALLADEEAADRVWEAWMNDALCDGDAVLAWIWLLIAHSKCRARGNITVE